MSNSLHPAIARAAAQAVTELMTVLRGALAVVVSTEDGFQVAAHTENTAQVGRLSAMASSLAALGGIAGDESGLGACDSLLIEAAGGHIVMRTVQGHGVSLILSVVTSREAVLGQALYQAKRTAHTLQESFIHASVQPVAPFGTFGPAPQPGSAAQTPSGFGLR